MDLSMAGLRMFLVISTLPSCTGLAETLYFLPFHRQAALP
jgi:hypothetical protein